MTAIIAGVSKDHGNDDARQVVHDLDELIEPTPPPLVLGKAQKHAADANDLLTADPVLVGGLPARAGHVLHAYHVDIHVLAIEPAGAELLEHVAAALLAA